MQAKANYRLNYHGNNDSNIKAMHIVLCNEAEWATIMVAQDGSQLGANSFYFTVSILFLFMYSQQVYYVFTDRKNMNQARFYTQDL